MLIMLEGRGGGGGGGIQPHDSGQPATLQGVSLTVSDLFYGFDSIARSGVAQLGSTGWIQRVLTG